MHERTDGDQKKFSGSDHVEDAFRVLKDCLVNDSD